MMTPLEQYRGWARRVLGKKLSRVMGVIYIFEVPYLEQPQRLQFEFYNVENAASFQCGKDGSSLELTDSPLQEIDLGEHGKEVIMDISYLPSLSRVHYKVLVNVYAVFSEVEDSYIGVKLLFEDGLIVFILNVGDEINIFESLPLSYEQENIIRYQEL